MKTLLSLMLCIICSVGNTQLVDVFNEMVYTDDGTIADYPEGYSTYRIYVRMQDPTDVLYSVFGRTNPGPVHQLTLGSTIPDAIFNTNFGGVEGGALNCSLFGFFTIVPWDSFITIGISNSCMSGDFDCDGAISPVYYISDPVNRFQESFNSPGVLSFAPTMILIDGYWQSPYDGNCNGNGMPPDNRVLIAQLTVPTGTLTYCLNIALYNDGNIDEPMYYVHGNDDPPGMIGDIPEIDGSTMGLCFSGSDPECNDPLACNYNPFDSANTDCLYDDACNGCTDYIASNFDPFATIDDGTCLYTIQGNIFNDINADGVFNNFDFVADNIEVVLQPLGLSTFSLLNGVYQFNDIPAGDYTLEVVLQGDYYDTSTPSSYSINTIDLPIQYHFGLLSSAPFYNVDLSNSQFGYNWLFGAPAHCNLPFVQSVNVVNNGNTTITPEIIITFDSDLNLGFTEPASTIVGNSAHFELDDLPPGTNTWTSLVFYAPTPLLNGEQLIFDTELEVYDEGNLVQTESTTYTRWVSCSFDPNAKSAYPEGYTEDHFIPAGTEIDFMIQFQNTGTDTAQNITVMDTISEYLDLSSFQLIQSSHTTIASVDEETRQVAFVHPGIHLPDSASSEENSHGFLVYRIKTNNDLLDGTIIENTAGIYFDDNSPIVTNTTWHTIIDCSTIAEIIDPDDEFCAEESGVFNANEYLVESFQWLLDNVLISTNSSFYQEFLYPGEFNLQLMTTNPVCSSAEELIITVHDAPDVFLQLNEQGDLVATSGFSSYEWFWQDESLEINSDSVYNPSLNGDYSVLATDEFGCTGISDPVFYSDVLNLDAYEFTVSPNPATQSTRVSFKQFNPDFKIIVTNINGKSVLETNSGGVRMVEIRLEELSPGLYFISLDGMAGLKRKLVIIGD